MFVIDLRRFVRLVACLVPAALLAATVPAFAADPRVERAPAAGWVDWLAPPAVNPDRLRAAEDGVYDLLYDTQTRLDDTHEVTFRRRLIKVIERAGLEGAAQTQIEFNPSFERLQVNRAAIWRDGRMIDLTAAANIEMLRQEKSLDDGIITGDRTAVVRLDDVRVGDMVDIAWTWQSVSSVWPGHYFSQPSMGWSVPLALTRYRLVMPASKPVAIRQSQGLPGPVVRRAGGMVEREWRVIDPDPVASTDRAPAWWHGWAYLDISTMTSWAAVADWGARHFQGDLTLPPAYAAKVDAIAARTADPGKRAIAALRLVQDSIRYTSLSIGAGGFIPRSPAEVIRSGFGDCKDKSQLLAVTLRRLGIPAWPAFTDIDEGPGLASRLPSAAAFDHVIVLARIGGRDRWFDATAAHQGGTMATFANLPYGYALPLRPGQASLAAIPNPAPAVHTMTVVETYRHAGDGLTLDVETVFSGDEADAKREELASSGTAKMERDFLGFYRDMYPGLVGVGQLRISDDRDANRLIIREAYRLPGTARDYAKTVANLEVVAGTLRGLYKDIGDSEGRTTPIMLPWTIKRAHRIVFDMPGYAINLPRLDDSHGPAFDLTTHAWHDGDRAILDFTLTGKAAILPASAAADYVRQMKALNDATDWTIDASVAGFAPIDASWLGLGLALLLLIGLVALGLLRKRNRRAVPAPRMPARTQLVIRHVPITRRDAA
ncbi:MAG: hypothetical protein JWN66_3175 [Sphingomonas bacterium]|uniref:DUF3857 domain-containing transglutaminase family protein n=1 Tax=Sphingomonas bacterium TaxID=1895847 RepID=UPI00262446DF|nr:DUF3857 domain-containing transglutaminase family protein [Sphingomonas bacterium]MDB5706059.1 hypothetical protein [Sphingomonas bacterium]